MSQKVKRLDNLQMSRAAAMILVLFIHADFFSTTVWNTPFLFGLFFPGGDGGVDLFFVLSGFIIYYIHHQDIGRKEKLLPYLAKRFARIYPSYWVVTFFLIPLHFIFPQFGLGNETKLPVILRSLFLVPSTHAPILHAAWTLIYEVLFYISFGFLIWFGFKRMSVFIGTLILISASAWFYTINQTSLFHDSIYYVFFSYHNFEFLLGMFGAYMVLRREVKVAKQFLLFGVMIFVSMLIFEFLKGQAIYSLRLFGYGLSSFLIITSLSSLEIYQKIDLSGNRALKFFLLLGNASFSIYLTHQVLISGIGRTLAALGIGKIIGFSGLTFITIFLTLFFGLLFYFIVEKPLLSYSRKKLLLIAGKIN